MLEDWEEYRLIEGALEELRASLPESDLGEVVDYALSTPGKRGRPLILVLSSEAFGASASRVMDAALAVELIHIASLVHDDILDEGVERRGAPSTFQIYGMEPALLCGDYLISRSMSLISGYSQKVIEAFSQACMEMAEGEMLDLSHGGKPEDYRLCVEKKTATLLAASARIGCLTAGADGSDVALLERYGMHIGLAYQIADDLNEFLGTDEVGLDRGKRSEKTSNTLPMIYGKDHSDEDSLKLCAEAILESCRAAQKALNEAGGDQEIKSRLGFMLQPAIEFSSRLGGQKI